MKKIIHLFLLTITILSLSACNIGADDTQDTANVAATSGLELTIQVSNAGTTFNTVGQTINLLFIVKNSSTSSLPGPVLVNSDKMIVTCPDLTTVGNLNAALESGESITCPGSYPITQNDLNAGSVTITATATAGGISSPPISVTVPMTPNKVLILTATANPTTYNLVGQTINYSFVIKNSGAQALVGPFTITDNKMVVTCIPTASGQLAPNEQMTCTGTYQINQTDMSTTSMTNTSTASGGGASSAPVNTTITNTTISPAPITSTPGNYVAGSTISHQVKNGEWLIQIARCYGTDYNKLRQANPAITNPRYIKPGLLVSVPNIGSVGPIYGPPCVVSHTVVSGETWESIAAKYNADVAVLKEANPVTLATGVVLVVPINSAGKNTPLPAATITVTPLPSLTPLPTLTPIPLPTFTPGPAPTWTPPPLPTIAYFTVNSNSVKVGSTIILSWSFSGQDLTQSRLTRSNPDGTQTPLYGGGDVPLTGTYNDLAATTGSFIYTLSVSSEFGGTSVKTVGVLVNP